MRHTKRVEKKHGSLPRRKHEDLTRQERLWLWYFDLEYDIPLTPADENYRKALEIAYKAVIQYYPRYSLHRVATFLSKKLAESEEFEGSREYRQCLTYVQDSINLFSEPLDVEKEFKRQLYINRFMDLSGKAEKKKDWAAAVRAVEKAAELENFNQETDEKMREMMKNFSAKEVTFAHSMAELSKLVEERRKERMESIPEAETVDDTE